MDIETALQRKDELTHDDPLSAATQTLEIVYRLIQDVSVVIDGEKLVSSCNLPSRSVE